MAAYISVPRDLTKVKSKVMFNLTARQLICFGAAAVVGVPLFFVLRDTAGNSGATLGMMAVMLPMFFLAMYQKNGQPAEKILRYYLQARFVRPKVRLYKTRNYYALLMKGDDTHQANGDRQILAKQLNISPHQLSYVTHSGEGEGLLFFGNVILPFVDHFPKDLELYRILTTKLNEISEGAQK